MLHKGHVEGGDLRCLVVSLPWYGKSGLTHQLCQCKNSSADAIKNGEDNELMPSDRKSWSQRSWTQLSASTGRLVGYQGFWVGRLGPGLSLFVVLVPVTSALLIGGLWLGSIPPRARRTRAPGSRLRMPTISSGIRGPTERIALPFVFVGVLPFPRWTGDVCRWHYLFEHHLVEFVDVLHDCFGGLLERYAVPHCHGQLPSGPLPVKRELLSFLWFAPCLCDHPFSIGVDVPFLSPPNQNHRPANAVDPVENCQEALGVPDRIIGCHYLQVVIEGEGLSFPRAFQQWVDFTRCVERTLLEDLAEQDWCELATHCKLMKHPSQHWFCPDQFGNWEHTVAAIQLYRLVLFHQGVPGPWWKGFWNLWFTSCRSTRRGCSCCRRRRWSRSHRCMGSCHEVVPRLLGQRPHVSKDSSCYRLLLGRYSDAYRPVRPSCKQRLQKYCLQLISRLGNERQSRHGQNSSIGEVLPQVSPTSGGISKLLDGASGLHGRVWAWKKLDTCNEVAVTPQMTNELTSKKGEQHATEWQTFYLDCLKPRASSVNYKKGKRRKRKDWDEIETCQESVSLEKRGPI